MFYGKTPSPLLADTREINVVLKLFTPKPCSVLGLDISSTAISLLEITHDKARYCVTGYGRWLLPEQVIEHGVIKKMDIVAHGIKMLVANADLSTRQAVLAVPDSSTITKIIQVHRSLSERDIEELVNVEAIKYMPNSTQNIHCDFNIVGSSSTQLNMLDVRLVATRAENVEQRVEIVRRAGLDVGFVGVESCAIERVGERLVPFGHQQTIAMFDMGFVYTHFCVLQGAKMIFSHGDVFGGKPFINTLTQRHGMEPRDVIGAIEQGGLLDGDVAGFFQSTREMLCLQLKRALHLFLSNNPHSTVEELVLAGGVAKLPGLVPAIQEQFNISTRV